MLKAVFKGILIVIGLMILIPLVCLLVTLVCRLISSLNFAAISGDVLFAVGIGIIIIASLIIIFKN